MHITEIISYPVKGFAATSSAEVTLSVAAGLPHDRQYAITHRHSSFDYSEPAWIARRNFLVVARSPKLAPIRATVDLENETLSFTRRNNRNESEAGRDTALFSCRLPPHTDHAELDNFLANYADSSQPGPFHLVQVPDVSLTDSPVAAVSIMNCATLRSLETVCGTKIKAERMRGNIWIDDAEPWCELNWMDRKLTIGGAKLKVFAPVERCAAINACPDTGVRDINVLKNLSSHFGHPNFGVLAKVVRAGAIKPSDEIRLAD